MAISDFSRVVRNVRFDTSGLDSVNSRWTDLSGFGRHLPLTAGTHAVSTVGGVDAWSVSDGTVYTEFKPPKVKWSVIMAIHSAASGSMFWYWTSGAYSGTPYATDDHAAATEPATWTAQDTAQFTTIGTTIRAQGATGSPSASTTHTQSQWNIVTFCFNAETRQTKIQINDGTPVVSTAAAATGAQFIDHRARLGYVVTTGSLSAACAYGQHVEIMGDVFLEQPDRLATEVATLMTAFGVP